MGRMPRAADLEQTPGEASGELRLLAAVLTAAVKELRETANGGAHPARGTHLSVRGWFERDHPSGLLTFTEVCGYLGLDAGSVRDQLLDRVAAP